MSLPNFMTKLRASWELVALFSFLVMGFLVKALPLLQYPRVGGDPFLHFEYSMALLNGKYSIPVRLGDTGSTMELYYPPLFHLISLGFFLAFPNLDPYMIMKIVASAFGALQIVPVYFIVKRVSGSSAGGLLASYSLLATRSDYEMLAWGGYANIAGLFLIACLVYAVITDRPILSLIFSAALALTHHLSTILMIAVLLPYFSITLWRRRVIPKSLIGLVVGAVVANVVFYRFALVSMFDYYTKFSPIYDQSLYVTSYILEQVGPLLLLSAVFAFALAYAYAGREFVKGKEVLLIWTIVPLLLSYAYLFGVQWHGVRWIHFIPQPLTVWTGIGFGYLGERKLVLIAFAFLFAVQLIGTLQGYNLDILRYVGQ